MKLIDVHCHLDKDFFGKEIDNVIKRAKEKNVKLIIPAGINPETNRHVLALGEKYDIVKPSLGIYPPDALKKELEDSDSELTTDFDTDAEVDFIYNNRDKIIAIGEVGMDFKNGSDRKMQEEVFRKMIELAIKIDKPLVIHSRQAEKEVIDILEEYDHWKIVMHCFSGKQSQVRRVREHKWFFSIPTNVVKDEHFQRIVNETPFNQILTETDAPFLSPYKDKKNEPAFVKESIKKMSELRRLPEIDVATLIYRNAELLFDL